MAVPSHESAIATLATTPALLRFILAPLPGDLLDRPSDGGWSPKDVVAHLILSERRGAIYRIRAIVTSDDPLLENRDENDEMAHSDLPARNMGELLDEFDRTRGEDVAWLRRLDASTFERSGRHSVVGAVTASEMLYHAAYHDCLHACQVTGMLQGQFEPLRGAMRAF